MNNMQKSQCMDSNITDPEQLEHMNQVAAYMFVVHDWHLYLDTHPFDKYALAAYKRAAAKADEVKKEYEIRYGVLSPMNHTDEESWQWIDDNWPWD